MCVEYKPDILYAVYIPVFRRDVRKKFVADATGRNANNITLQTTADWRDSTVVTCVRNVLSSTKKA